MNENIQYASVFIVVLYGKEVDESTTLTSLFAMPARLEESLIVVWNNGPTQLRDSCHEKLASWSCQARLALVETPENRPLSWIYNDAIGLFDCDSYVLLDDDTQLTEEYVEWVTASKAYVSVPLLASNGAPESPQVGGVFTRPPYPPRAKLLAAGTALRISHHAVASLRARYGSVFDEHFALYGVDSSFFYRLRGLSGCDRVELGPVLEHSFSRLEKNEARDSARFRERSEDLGLQLRHYPSPYLLRLMVRECVAALFGRNRVAPAVALKAMLRGRHTRCQVQLRRKQLDVRTPGTSA